MRLFYFRHNNGYVPPIHRYKIRFCELTVVLTGEIVYTTGQQNIVLRDGDVLFLPEETVRSRKASNNADYFSFNFYFDETDERPDLPPLIPGGNTLEISLLLSACNEMHRHAVESSDLEQIGIVLTCILKRLDYNLRLVKEYSLVSEIKHYVRDHITEKLTLEQIARATHFSPAYCSSVFKRETGNSIINYVINEKIALAQKLVLEDTDLKLIAEHLGFSDYNYFSRLFKKRTQYAPSAYKALFFS